MSTQIDPVTGLPMYVPPPLEQIPFKNPPYPWNDLTDNPVVPRTTYYGDDSIPTVATVAGMHPTELGGQTVNTDGNHALLVNNVGGGGISSGTYVKSVGAGASADTGNGVIFHFPLISYQAAYVLGGFICIGPPDGHATAAGFMDAILFASAGFAGGQDVILCRVTWQTDGTTLTTINQSNMLPIPINVANTYGGSTVTPYVILNSSPGVYCRWEGSVNLSK